MVILYEINHMRTAVHAPQSNASERVNQCILVAIRAYRENDHRNWDVNLPSIELALRTSIHTATGVIAFFAMFGHNMFFFNKTIKSIE